MVRRNLESGSWMRTWRETPEHLLSELVEREKHQLSLSEGEATMRHWFDDDDALSWLMLASETRKWALGLLLAASALVLWLVLRDARECEQRTCPAGQHAIVAANECVCVAHAR